MGVGPELQVRLGQPAAAFRPRVGQHRGGVQVLDPPGPGEFVYVGGDAVDDRPHPCEVDGQRSLQPLALAMISAGPLAVPVWG